MEGFLMLGRINGYLFALTVFAQLAIADHCLAAVEDRINEAMPPPKSIEYAKSALLRLATDAGVRPQVESEINAKLRVRALDCAQGYAPAPFASKGDIAAHFGVSDCFERSDNTLAMWMGWRRVGILVKLPPIRPIPKSVPPYVLGADFIQQVKFAADAGVVLLWTNRSSELIDLNNGKRISHLEGLGGDILGELSSNGRVLTTSMPGGTALIDIESGEMLARVQSIFPQDFSWLGQGQALIYRAAMLASLTVDFESGNEHPIKFSKDPINRIIPRLANHNEFLALTSFSAMRVRMGDGRSEDPLTLLDQKPFKIQNWLRNPGVVTADGRFYVIASQDLNLVSTDTLVTTTIAIAPFEIRILVPLPNPDLILLNGDNPGINPNTGWRQYVYSVSRQTFAPLDRTDMNQGRIVYLANVHKLGVVTQNRIALLDTLPVGEALSREDFVATMMREQDQHRTAMAEQNRGPRISGTGPVRVETLPGARVTMLTSGSNWTVSSAPGVDKTSDSADVEGIGIVQTTNFIPKPDGTKEGVAVVHVRRGNGEPLSLVLSSHGAVRWTLIVERGAVIKSIMTAGPQLSEVVGAGSVPVTHITNAEASRTDTPEYEGLQAQVMRTTGARIRRFQGVVEGNEFTVDGR
jgi:hypothetical protein